MKGDVCMYPYHLEARRLPVYLTGLGGTAWQMPIRRPEGYFWHQVLLCTEGSGTLETGGRQQPIRAGDAFLLPAEQPHAYWPETERWDVRWITFDGEAAAPLLTQLDMASPQVVPGGAATLLPLYERMQSALTGDPLHGHHTCSALVYMYLMEFHRLLISRIDGQNQLLTTVLRFIDAHYGRDLSLSEMADCAGVTPQHLCRVFREAMRMRPGEYLTQRRIQAARTLIRTEELPLSEIARRVGFSSGGYFSTVFRRWVGMSPGEYRRRGG